MKGEIAIETINELRIWLEGEFKLVAQGQKTANDDLRLVRQRVHDLSNDVAKVIGLNLEDKLKLIGEHDDKLETMGREAASLKAVIATVKAAYAIGGAVFGGAVAVVLEIAKVIHP